jgi:hypothetical protein
VRTWLWTGASPRQAAYCAEPTATTAGARWCQWSNTVLTDLETSKDELALVLQDDVRLCRDFLPLVTAAFDGIDDPARHRCTCT